MSKTVYVVRGMHDGTLGVFGNVKGAYKCAMEYVTRYNDPVIEVSYNQACKELRNTDYYGSVELCLMDELTNVMIEAFPFNIYLNSNEDNVNRSDIA